MEKEVEEFKKETEETTNTYRDDLTELIKNVIAADEESIIKTTADVLEACKCRKTLPKLLNIIVAAADKQMRHCSALLLGKYIVKEHQWNNVSVEEQKIIKQGLLNALMQEQEVFVRKALVKVVATLLNYRARKSGSYINDVLKFICDYSSSTDPDKNLIGSNTFALLADISPNHFMAHIETVCDMLFLNLLAHETAGNKATSAIFNIICGMTNLMLFTAGHKSAESTMEKVVPLIIKILRDLTTQQDLEHLYDSFDILESMVEFNPKVLKRHVGILVDFCLEVSSNRQLNKAVRSRAISYIGRMMCLKKFIIKLKLVDTITKVIFNLIAIEPENDGDNGGVNLSSIATHTMDVVALNIPSAKLLPALILMLKSALQSGDSLQRRAAYLSIGVVAEGCSEAICDRYLERVVNIVKEGITDALPTVRNAAFFALGQCADHLQPGIFQFAPKIMPILFQFMKQLCIDLKADAEIEHKNIEHSFYALEKFCQSLDDQMTPYLPALMEILFEAMNPNNSVRVRQLALSSVSAAASATEENMLPYLTRLIPLLQSYLAETNDIITLRIQAIDTWAALVGAVGKESFKYLIKDTINLSLKLLVKTENPAVRAALYNLMASLSRALREEMTWVYPKIIDHVFASVLSTEEIIVEFRDVGAPPTVVNQQSNRLADDGREHIAGYSVDNSYLEEKVEAIWALKEFAEHAGPAFRPYLKTSYRNVYGVIDHPQEDLRKVSVQALHKIVMSMFRYNEIEVVKNFTAHLLSKLTQIVLEDVEIPVVLATMEVISDMLSELKKIALPSAKMRKCVFTCIVDVIQGRATCQNFETTGADDGCDDKSEYDEAIIRSALNILPAFGLAMTPARFTSYFNRTFPIIFLKLIKGRKREILRAFAYGCFADCFMALGKNCGGLFNTFRSIMIDGLSDKSQQVRQCAIFGLGELVLYSGRRSYKSYTQILNVLSQLVSRETKPTVLDNICGAVSRMIIANHALVPIEKVLPVYLRHLPLREHFEENRHVFKCLQTLCIKGYDTILKSLEQIIQIAIHVLSEREYTDEATYNIAIDLLLRIYNDSPEIFATGDNLNSQVIEFLRSLSH